MQPARLCRSQASKRTHGSVKMNKQRTSWLMSHPAKICHLRDNRHSRNQDNREHEHAIVLACTLFHARKNVNDITVNKKRNVTVNRCRRPSKHPKKGRQSAAWLEHSIRSVYSQPCGLKRQMVPKLCSGFWVSGPETRGPGGFDVLKLPKT